MFRWYIHHAGEVATTTGLIAEDAARTTVHIELYDVGGILSPAHKTGIGMCGAPDAHNGCGNERGEVHVGTVHRYHNVKVTHKSYLLVYTF